MYGHSPGRTLKLITHDISQLFGRKESVPELMDTELLITPVLIV